jgi:hypothetical protein
MTVKPTQVLTTILLGSAATLAACGDDGGDDDHEHDAPDASNLEAITCEVAIVGGGAGGLHTAFRLAPELGDGVCLFEKEAELGGRIKDVPMTDAADSPRVGVGARRVMEGQQILFDLATELGIELQAPPNEADLINARGEFAFSKDPFLPLYPGATPHDADPETDEETWMYEELLGGPARADVTDFRDFQSYVRYALGFEEFDFLHDMSRFRADFEYPIDARSYMDYLDEEWNVCCQPSYPVGGMSAFIRGMQAAAEDDGARIFTSEPVADISRATGGGYTLTTGTHLVTAEKVVIAAPPYAFQWITGDVVDDIREQQQFKDILEVKVVTITQWWPDDWWSTIVNPGGTAPDNNVWRAWTTEHCVNFIEIPIDPYGADQNVTRSVYNDGRACSDYWEAIAAQGTDAVEAEIKRGLEHLFNENLGTTAPVVIPDPTKTVVQIWPAAWHWLRAGTEFTKAQVYDWAVEPLTGEDVALVGEAYNVNRSGWSDAAYKSSINLLNTKYGLSLPGLERTAPRQGPRAPWSARRN